MNKKLELAPVLTIAGSDCSGGAGLEADLKAFSAQGTFGMAVVLSVVALNTKKIYGYHLVPLDVIAQQFEAIFDDIPPLALKTGLLGNAPTIELVLAEFKKRKPKNVVIDPVMFSKHGDRMIDDASFELYKGELMSYADVLTPNKLELELLSGRKVENLEQLKDASRALIDLGAKGVLAKGGRYFPNAIDVFNDGKDLHELPGFRLDTTSDHGAGCTLSAAIAANLAHGTSRLDAVIAAKNYTYEAMRQAPKLGGGHGPLNHFWPFFGEN